MSLPYKFVYADGRLGVAPGWRKDVHHMNILQDMGFSQMPYNMYAGTYGEDTLTGQPRIEPDWEILGHPPTDEELMDMVQQHLQKTSGKNTGKSFCIMGDGQPALHWFNIGNTIYGLCDAHYQEMASHELSPETADEFANFNQAIHPGRTARKPW